MSADTKRTVVLHTDYPSTTTHSNNHHHGSVVRVPMCSIGYEVCGLRQKTTLIKMMAKKRARHCVVCGFVTRTTQPKISSRYYGSIVKWPKTSAFHVDDTGSNPVGATNPSNSSIVQSIDHLYIGETERVPAAE